MLDSSYYIASIILQSITLLVLTATLIFFGLQWAGASREVSLKMRPYLGFDSISFKQTKQDGSIEFDVWILNYGNIPAVNAKMYGEFIVNNHENTNFICDTKGAVFPYAKTPERWLVGVNDIDKRAILSGKKALIHKLNIEYFSSTGKKYFTRTSRTFNPEGLSWLNVECQLT